MGRAALWRRLAPIVLLAAACGGDKSSNGAPASGTAAVQPAAGDPRAAIFVQKGCPQCHSISALGVKSQAEAGPDLTTAYEDVRSRFGVKLDEFFAAPSGTMQMVLTSMIQLSRAERDSIIHVLEELHEEREQREEHGDHKP